MMSPFLRAASASLMLLARPQAFGGDAEAWAPAGVLLAQPAPANPTGEFQQKARILSLLPEYITWPADSGQSGRPLVIGVVGDSPFGSHLDAFFTPGQPQSRKGRVLYLNNLRAIETCDVLFICESESERLYEILRRVKDRPILTMGASPDFARRGVMVNLVLDRGRIGLEVNRTACRLSRLEVSAHILKNAKIIE